MLLMRNYYIPPSGFYIGNFEIKFYGIIMALSMLIGVFLAMKLAKKYYVEMPIVETMSAIVGGKVTPKDAVYQLMTRRKKAE